MLLKIPNKILSAAYGISFLLGLNLLCVSGVLGQTKFNLQKLKNPKKYGPEVKAQMKELLVYEYQVSKGKHAVFLKNGLRSSQFISPKLWLQIKDTVYPYRVDIVYSRYPVKNGIYSEIYPLLCNRLQRTFELDPELNDTSIKFRTILQTHTDNDEQVDKLFHGVVIWYRTPSEEADGETDSNEVQQELVQTERGSQSSTVDLIETIRSLRDNSLLNDSMRSVLDGKTIDMQKRLIQEYLAKSLLIKNNIPLSERTPLEMMQFKRQVSEYLKNNPFSDSVVWKVFDRHPEWIDALAINDWTGSMYGYGAQVLHWHLNNYKHSGLRYLSLFNDGDNKTTAQKVIGETGGIYSAEASDIPSILSLFNLVRINGGGGDRPENDVEAILSSMERYPNHKEIILIADNYACIRDIELAYKIKKPVRVIVCGYDKTFGVNPHLAYLAKITNGGLYTLTSDLENLRLELAERGEILHNKDNRFVVSPMNCLPKTIFELNYGKESFITYTNLDSAIANKSSIRKLDLSHKNLQLSPKKIGQMKQLLSLNLGSNNLKKLPNHVKNLQQLKEIDLSKNQLSQLPPGFYKLKYLEVVLLQHNLLEDIDKFYRQGFYVKRLDISHNNLAQINGLNQLKNLKYAQLSHNKISELPLEINQLKKLVSLDLSNNQLLYLPRTIIGLIKLEELNLENNQLGSLPPNLNKLRKLKSLNLAGNPIGEKEKERIRNQLPLVEINF